MKNQKMLPLVALLAVMGSTAVYAESHAEMTTDAAAEVIDSAIEVAEEMAEPVAEEMVEPVAEEMAEPVAEEMVEPVAEEMAEPVAEEMAEPVAEEMAEPVAEEVVEPAVEVTGDAADAEKSRVVSETSIAIFSQNPYIQSIMEKTTHIQAARLKEIMARGDDILLLDVRPRSEFESTPGIEGTAMNIPRNFLEVEAYEKLTDKDAAIVIVSSKGIRGGLAANTLSEMGYTNVRNLLGGVEGWTK